MKKYTYSAKFLSSADHSLFFVGSILLTAILSLAHCSSGGGGGGGGGDNSPPSDDGPAPTAYNLQISVGYSHACAILEGGGVKCWGKGSDGKLGQDSTANIGDGGMTSGTAHLSVASAPLINLGADRTAKAVSAGEKHTCAILDNDSVKCWGKNNNGQLGLGDRDNRGDGVIPDGMEALASVDLGTGRTAKALVTGADHTCVILDNDSVKCWGFNHRGQLGYGDTGLRGSDAMNAVSVTPAVNLGAGRTAKAISAGASHTCAILDDDSLKCWGEGSSGRLGQDSTDNIGDGGGSAAVADIDPINLGSGAKSLSLGKEWTCAILDDDSAKCWGRGDSTAGTGLGQEDHTPFSGNHIGDNSGEMALLNAMLLGSGRTAKAVATLSCICLLLDNGGIKCWGRNNAGELGRGDTDALNIGDSALSASFTTIPEIVAIDLGSGRTAKAIDAGDQHVCAVLDDNSLKCWGKNDNGQLGLGDTDNRGDASDEMGDDLPALILSP